MTDGATATDRAEEHVGAAVHGLELLGRAARQRAIYPKGHPAAGLAIEQARTAVRHLLGDASEAEVSLSRGRIAVNGRVLPEGAASRVDLAPCLRDRGISRFGIRAGIEDDELIALLEVLGSDPEALQERGGPQALLPEKDDPHLALTEIEYARYVRASDAEEEGADEARAADGGGGLLGASPAATELLDEAGLEQFRGLLEQPQLLAQHLLTLVARETGEGDGTGVGGGSGAGIGDGTGKGIGTGGNVPLTVGGLEIDAGDRGSAIVALSLQRLGEAAFAEDPQDWAATRRRLADAVRLLSPSLRWRTLAADVTPAGAKVDVLAEVAAEFSSAEAAELIPSDLGEAINAPSVTLQRLLRRLAPNRERLAELSPVLRERLREAGLDDSAYDSVVGTLLRDLAAAYSGSAAGGADRRQGLRGTDDAERRERREALGDLVGRLSGEPLRTARVTLALELLVQSQNRQHWGHAMGMLEREVGAVLRGGSKGVLLAVCETLEQQYAGDSGLDEAARQRARELLWRVRGAGVAQSIVEALRAQECPDRQSLILLLGQMGPEGEAALVDLIRGDARGRDHEAALTALAHMEDERRVAEVGKEPTPEQKGPSLRDVLLDPSCVGSPALVEALAKRDDQFALKYLTIGLTHGEPALRSGIVQALAEHRGANAVDLLILGLQNADPSVREMAAAALGRLGDHRAAEHLMRTAQPAHFFDTRVRLRAAALLALGSLRYEPAIPFLASVLRRRSIFRRAANDALRTAAAEALERVRIESALQALARARSDRCAGIREIAARAARELQEGAAL